MRRRSRALAAGYGALLVASWAVTARQAETPPLSADQWAVWLRAPGGRPGRPAVRLVYRDVGPADNDKTLPVVLLHGSPGRMTDFRTVAPVLARARRVLVPDLPGFGRSSRHLPDYSIRAHARYVLDLIDRLRLDRVHVVGYSMGGGVALEMAGLEPHRVASLSLLASIGLQEYELTGRYHLNHVLHGVQLAALWGAYRLVPHFGWMDDALLDVGYARNFFDTDQRPLRDIIRGLAMPVLILHGTDDVLVPYEAAVEHHRLVPQSELRQVPHGHFAPFAAGQEVGGLLADFLARVESGAAPTRASAEPRRLADAARPPSGHPHPRGFGLVISVLSAGAVITLVLGSALVVARRRSRGRRG